MFDVIFCRNVLIYFDAPTKKRVLEAICKQLAPDGVLFLGGAETVLGLTESLKPIAGESGAYAPASGLREVA
jgi:chemotaxis protein methyltransferase CheR